MRIHTFVLCNLTVCNECLVALVYVNKSTFLCLILLPQFSFPLAFFILRVPNREADDVQMERKGS